MKSPLSAIRLSSILVLLAASLTWAADPRPVPLYEGLGKHHRQVTTSSSAAQAYFDQGLVWAYAFNHDEAIRSFEAATRHDPHCAMAWWGIALCHGPHINNPLVAADRDRAAWTALQKATGLKDRCADWERALIEALPARYSDPPPEDRAELDQRYAQAMEGVYRSHPEDADVGTLYAESLMNLRPWDLWTRDGDPQPGTEKIIEILEQVLSLAPHHPGANHLYIHAVEASPRPERASEAADRLRDLVPASSHLVHMPSHIDVLTGRWEQAVRQNELAVEADRCYRQLSPEQGFYHVYMLHNHHMLAFAAMMEGRCEQALGAARAAVDSIPEDYRRSQAALVDPYMGAVYDVLKRFGMWDEILREPPPPESLPMTTAMWRFSRGVALAAKGQVDEAEREEAAFRKAVAALPEDAVFAISPAADVFRVAAGVLRGEIHFREGQIDDAVNELRQAVAAEAELRYMEPPEWIQPVRHTLGAVLVSAGRFDEAESVYREDLVQWPNNGWSLHGLSRCLRARGDSDQADRVEAQFRQAWSRADTRIASSCLCVP